MNKIKLNLEYIEFEKKIRNICILPGITINSRLYCTTNYRRFVCFYGEIALACSLKGILPNLVGEILSYVVDINIIIEYSHKIYNNIRAFGYIRYVNIPLLNNCNKLKINQTKINEIDLKTQKNQINMEKIIKKTNFFDKSSYSFDKWHIMLSNYTNLIEHQKRMNITNFTDLEIEYHNGKNHLYVLSQEIILCNYKYNVVLLKMKQIQLNLKKDNIINKKYNIINNPKHKKLIKSKYKYKFKFKKISHIKFKPISCKIISLRNHSTTIEYDAFQNELLVLTTTIEMLNINQKQLLDQNSELEIKYDKMRRKNSKILVRKNRKLKIIV